MDTRKVRAPRIRRLAGPIAFREFSMRMRPERLVKARIVGFEMAAEPGFQPRGEIVARDLRVLGELIHDVPDFVEELFMIALMRIEIGVFLFAHETLLKREVRGNALEQVTEKGLDSVLSRVRG